MGHHFAIICSRRSVGVSALTLLVLPLLAVAAIVFSPGRGAEAALIGCEQTVPARSTEGLTYTLDLAWDLGPVVGSGTIETDILGLLTGVPVYLDGDTVSDGLVILTLSAGNGASGVAGLDTYFGVTDFVENNVAYQLLLDGYGLDYSQETTLPADPDDNDAGPVQQEFSLFLLEPENWEAGTFGIDATAHYTDGDDVYHIRLDTTGADVSGSSMTTTPWPQATGVAIFDDNVLHDTLAVGVTSVRDWLTTPTIAPTSNMLVDVQIDQIAGVPHDDHIRLGLTGALADDGAGNVTSVGMPGAMAAAIVNECDALPQETFVGTSHNGNPSVAMPDTFETEVSMYGAGDFDGTPGFDPDAERTLYVDSTVTDPPNLIAATIGANNADVDGDGRLDGFDLDNDVGADGRPDDRLPWEYLRVHHDGTTVPDLDAVVARRPVGNAEGNLYVAASVEDVPPDVSLDRAGIPTGADPGGDGEWDDVNGDGVVDKADVALNADVGSLAFCPKDRDTYPPRCATPSVPAGRVQVGFQAEIPEAETDESLPVEYQSFSPAPSDIVDTADDGHFTPDPADWLVVDTESTVTQDAVGFDVVHTGITAAGVDITGIKELAWDLREETAISVLGDQFESLGAELHSDNLTTGSQASVWSVLADVPDSFDVAFDTAGIEVDGDAPSVTLNTKRTRTAVALGVDIFQPAPIELPQQGARTIAASAWVGTGTGAEDGWPANSTLTLDLEGTASVVALEPNPEPECAPGPLGIPCPGEPNVPEVSTAPAALDAGFTTRTEAQEAAGIATHGTVSLLIPKSFTLNWHDDGSTITSAALSTCPDADDPCPASDVATRVVTSDWSGPVGHDALGGIDMLPVPDEDGTEFPDFTELPGTAEYPEDWAHYVLHDDPHMMNETFPDLEEVDDENKWGVDVHLAEVTAFGFGSSTTFWDPSGPQGWQEVFDRVDVCFDARTRTPVGSYPQLGLGLYRDEYRDNGASEPAAFWVDANLALDAADLRSTLQFNSPADDSGGVIGDLTTAQVEYATLFEDEARLAQVDADDCAGNHWSGNGTLTGRVRRGTASSVAQVLQLGTQSSAAGAAGIPVPADPGIDAAFYTAEIGDTSFQALDAALQLDLPNSFTVFQPVVRRCGVGNWNLTACHDLPEYDATTSSDVYFGIDSDSEGALGDLDVEYLTEPADRPEDGPDECGPFDVDGVDPRLGDPCTERAALHVDRLGGAFAVDGTFEHRPRDGYVRADLTATNERAVELGDVEFTYRDDYDPATLGDPLERGATDQPIAWLVLQDAGRALSIDATMWAPRYGWNGSAFTSGDCHTGWPSAIDRNHVFPADAKPSTWPTLDRAEPRLVAARVPARPDRPRSRGRRHVGRAPHRRGRQPCRLAR